MTARSETLRRKEFSLRQVIDLPRIRVAEPVRVDFRRTPRELRQRQAASPILYARSPSRYNLVPARIGFRPYSY